MAHHADDYGDVDEADIFVYIGGLAPRHVTHVIIDKSVDEIDINKIMQSLVVIVSSALKNRGLQRWSATEAPPFRVGNVPAGRL